MRSVRLAYLTRNLKERIIKNIPLRITMKIILRGIFYWIENFLGISMKVMITERSKSPDAVIANKHKR